MPILETYCIEVAAAAAATSTIGTADSGTLPPLYLQHQGTIMFSCLCTVSYKVFSSTY